MEVIGCKPPAVQALGSPASTGQSPACGARYCSLSAAQCAERGWYRGGYAFVPIWDGGLFFCFPKLFQVFFKENRDERVNAGT